MSLNNLCKRIIPCLDVDNGRTVKGVRFQDLRDIGDPVEMGIFYQNQGADELVFLDISASHEGRSTMMETVCQVANALSIPFTVGGGISNLDDVKRLLASGADKVSVNTAAVQRPDLIMEIAHEHGSQCCVLAIDARSNPDCKSGWEVLTHGGRNSARLDVLDWAKRAVELGAGEILLTSWDKDGTLEGFDLEMVSLLSEALPVPVIASGGARDPRSFVDVFRKGSADAALAASIFHDGTWTINAVKNELAKEGIVVRLC